jgi:hypothetical protein
MSALEDLVRAGTVRYIGVSDTPAWKIVEANMTAHLRGWAAFIGLQRSALEHEPSRNSHLDSRPQTQPTRPRQRDAERVQNVSRTRVESRGLQGMPMNCREPSID